MISGSFQKSVLWCATSTILVAGTAQASLPAAGSEDARPRASVIVLVGAPGEEEFGKQFQESAEMWRAAIEAAQARGTVIGADTNASADSNESSDLATFRAALKSESTNGLEELWIVMLGHGTWDGREARFNLRGPDFSASELATWLKPFTRPIAVINATSSSAPYINALSGTDRVVISATKSGSEDNYARFGSRISEAIASPGADLDKDGQTSLLEAFLFASRQVEEFYKSEGRLATEHALLDDNGDGRGTPTEFFRGLRAVKTAQDAQLDGLRAHQWHLVRNSADQQLSPGQRKVRDGIEFRIGQLRQRKAGLAEDEYYRELETLLTNLGEFLRTSQ